VILYNKTKANMTQLISYTQEDTENRKLEIAVVITTMGKFERASLQSV
jgi:hypothetical protein